VRERLLVNFFYAHPVGHAIEALHYANGHHAADPDLEVAVALNAATPVELASFCPFVSAAFAIEHPFVEPGEDSAAALATVPREWTWVVDDGRRHQDIQLQLFPGLRDYYAASDRHLVATRGRRVAGWSPPAYLPHQRLTLRLPEPARAAAAVRLGERDVAIALMPAGSSERALYPSLRSWRLILDALADAFPGVRIALVGKREADGRTSTAFGADELAVLLAHRSRPVDCFDVALTEQLAVVEACDVFLAPHTGFGLAALAVGTPWLALSGGRWFEYFFNHVPFRSILPDTARYPSFSQFEAPVVSDGDDGPRTPSMTERRVREDLDHIIGAARELVGGSVSYEQCLRDYFTALLAAHQGDASAIWSIDGVHAGYLPPPPVSAQPGR
jgi:hypothetical protein